MRLIRKGILRRAVTVADIQSTFKISRQIRKRPRQKQVVSLQQGRDAQGRRRSVSADAPARVP